jgi:hypothetical protein
MKLLRNSRGQSLVQVLIASAMGIVVMLVIATIQTNQARENQALSEKMASNDFQQQMFRSFQDGSLCTSLLTGLQFDSTHAVTGDPNQPVINIPSSVLTIPVSLASGAPPLVTVGKVVSPLAISVISGGQNPFQVTNLVGSSSGGAGSFNGSFVANYDATKLKRSMRGASVQLTLKTTAVGTTQTVASCSMTGAGACWVQGPNGLTATTCGNIGIGTTTPGSLLEVAGNITATTFLYSSDRRLKQHINPLDGFDLARKLRGVSFQWKNSGKDEMGFIAQEVEAIAPSLVVTQANGMKAVKYGNITALLVEAFKTEDAKVEALTEQNQNLMERVEALERQLDSR